MTKTIAIAIQYPINQLGGTEVLVKSLALGLSRDYHIYLISPDASNQLGAELESALAGHIPLLPEYFVWKTKHLLASKLKQLGVVFAHINIGGLWDWHSRYMHRCPLLHISKVNIPFMTTIHGVFEYVPSMLVGRPKLFRYALMPYALASRLRLSSAACREYFVSQHDYIKACKWLSPYKSKFGQIYHSQLGDTPAVDFSKKEKVIICVGTIGGRKGQPYLAEAFSSIAKRYPDWILQFIGRIGVQSDFEKAQGIVRNAGITSQVRFTGPVSDEELLVLFRKGAIFAMPSTGEGLGLSLQEAIYHGNVPIGSRVGGIPELIEHQVNGLLVDPANPGQLAQGLCILMDSIELRKRYAMAGLGLLSRKNMSRSAMLDTYRAAYNSCLTGGK